MIVRATILLACFFAFSGLQAQSDSSSTKPIKNVIRWNPTPMLVVGNKSIVLGYQRVLPKNRSVSINVGYLELKPMSNRYGAPINFFQQNERGGFDVTADLRFYFKDRNKYPAPDGLYWGPYTSWYRLTFSGKSTFDFEGLGQQEVGVDANLDMFSLGIQLGYQFILRDRFSIDLFLVGPSYTHYSFLFDLNASVNIEPGSPYYEYLKEVLGGIIPGSGIIMRQASFNSNGRSRLNYFGFRYGFQIGYAF